ncbi:Topless-related protein 2 [Vitis vinifera]|uniref:Topless-related protein 2 n=1 Tax=Vitis vinifera TaxID=29760 RepID=A0A438F1P1_VITVI|nr:Topless-related protein 2 [Vitis vinifera]
MSYPRKDCVAMILKFLEDKNFEETAHTREHDKAVEILSNDLKVFAQYNSELYKEMALLITVDDFRKHASLTKYGDTRSARASIFREIKKGIEANPVFQGKFRVPAVDARVGQWSLQMSNLQI